MSHHFAGVLCLLFCLVPCRGSAAERMVEIDWKGQKRVGTVMAHDPTTGWFLQRDGRMDPVPLREVGEFRPMGTFRPFSAMELSEKLRQEFGRRFTVSATSHYVLVVPRTSRKNYGEEFESLYRQFVVTFGARGFRLHEPRFPLVAIVFPDEAQFLAYCKTEGVQPMAGLRGYYLTSSNRIALFEEARPGAGSLVDLDSTVTHEAVHQVAFNTGVHSRVGTNPTWVVEGLATVFESAAARENRRSLPPSSRINASRYQTFRNAQGSRAADSLARLVQSDDVFRRRPLDAYGEAWALTFYLVERRSADYTAYLQRLAQRDPLEEYSPEQRLADFQKAFGRDLSLLEAHLVRFMDELAVTSADKSTDTVR